LCLTIGQQIFAARRAFGSSMERPGGGSASFVAAQYAGLDQQATVNGNMIAPDYLKRVAAWSRELNEREPALKPLKGAMYTNR
jgi:hypothetical protein